MRIDEEYKNDIIEHIKKVPIYMILDLYIADFEEDMDYEVKE